MFDRILLTTDGSDLAERAAPYAVELAEAFEATLHVIYVVDTDSMGHSMGPEQVERLSGGQLHEMTEVHERAASAIDSIRAYTEGREVRIDPVIEAGVPYKIIADWADEHGIDVIVMTSQGRGGVRRALMGSVTERVARSTDAAVLIVDPKSTTVQHRMAAAG